MKTRLKNKHSSERSPESKDMGVVGVASSYDGKTIWGSIVGILFFLILYVISRYNYLFFHTLTELFSITIAWSLFVVAWNSRHLSNNKAFVFIGIAYLFIGSIDLVHTLSYKGLGVIDKEWGANPATQLWIAARFMQGITFFIFPLLFFKQVRQYMILVTYSVITVLIFIAIFYLRIFPDCFVEGLGLTLFKKVSEYIICVILFSAWILLYRRKKDLSQITYRLMTFAIALTIVGELAFTFYISVYGISNLVGHYFKILSFYLIYLALVRNCFKHPYDTLFRELNASEKKFRSLFEETISAVALYEIICDKEGKPIDYRFLDINSGFEKLTGLEAKKMIGKPVLEVLPNTERYWIESYGQVALTGKPIQFDNYSNELKKHFEVRAYSPKHGQFVTIFNDITDKKNSDIEKDKLIGKLQKAAKEIKTLRGILPICSHCKKIRDDKGYWNQIESYIHEHSDAEFSHSICQECAEKHYPDMGLYDDNET